MQTIRRIVAVAVLIVGLSSLLSAQDTTSFVLGGVVTNSVSGQPVARALVTCFGRTGQNTALSGTDGKFQFTVTAGDYFCRGEKPGFPARPGLRGVEPSEIHVTGNTNSVVIDLQPEGVIAGHVEDSEHDPLPSAYVGLSNYTIVGGRRKLVRVANTRTDEDGNFRFAGLQRNDYYLVMGNGTSVAPITSRSGDQRDWGYAGVYYPGVDSIASASPVHIEPGQRADVVFNLKPQRVFHVSGRVMGMPPVATSIWFQRLQVPFFGMRFPVNPANGEFRAEYVPAGDYTVFVSVVGNTRLVAEQQVTVGADLRGLVVQLNPTVQVSVAISGVPPAPADGENRRRSSLFVRLVPEEWWCDSANTLASSTLESLQIGNVEPCHYNVEVNPLPAGLRIQSMRSGSVDLLQHKLAVGTAPPEPIEITLAADVGNLEVALASKNLARLVAIPLFTSTQPAIEGVVFEGVGKLADLSPGEYRVFAFDSIEGVAFREPDVQKQFESKSLSVNVTPGSTIHIQPELIRTGK